MSETLLNWLNKEVKLSITISDISSQFANGYYFGELLSKYQLLPTFNEFKNTKNTLDITKNYGLLQKAFADLSIQLTEVQKREILMRKKYKAEMYLFKLKQKISGKLIDLDSIMERSSVNQLHHLYKELNYGNFPTIPVDTKQRKLQSARPTLIRGNFSSTIENLKTFVPTQKEKNIINDIIHEEEYLSQKHSERKNKITNLESKKHKNEIEKDKENLEQWKKEIKKKNNFDNNLKEQFYKDSIQYRTETLGQFAQSSEENKLQVKAFDQNLSKMGLDLKTIDPKIAKNQNKTVSTDIFMKRIQQQIAEKEKSRKDKEKRQRKLLSAKIPSHQRLMIPPQTATTVTNNLFGNTNQNFYKNSTRATTAKIQTAKAKVLPPLNPIKENYNEWNDYISVDVYDEKRFFKELDKETTKYRTELMLRKKSKRERDNIIIAPIVGKLIDLVEECYTYQVINNRELVELDEWKTLMEKFIKNERLTLFDYQEHNEEEEDNKTTKNDNSSFNFDKPNEPEKEFGQYEKDELLNFLNYCGEYGKFPQTQNVKLDIIDIMGNEIKILQNDIDSKVYNTTNNSIDDMTNNSNNQFPSLGMKFNEVYEPRTEDLEMLKIPKENLTNTFYGEIIGDIVDRHFQQKQEVFKENESEPKEEEKKEDEQNILNIEIPKEKTIQKNDEKKEKDIQIIEEPKDDNDKDEEHSLEEIFNSIPIKATFIGNAFSGKTTQAKLLNSTFNGIKVYSINLIIKNLLDIQDKVNTPIESHPKFKSLKKAQIEQMKKEKVQQEEILKPYKALLEKLNALENKEKINDELQINFLIQTIKLDFQYKDNQTLLNEIQAKRDRIAKLNEELKKIKEEQVKKPKAKVKEEQYIKEELKKMSANSYRGFIIVDFPKNVEQARIFEYKISNYTQTVESNRTEADLEKERLLSICDKEIKSTSQSIKDCSLNKFLIFDITEEDIMKRVENRKLDPQTGIIYHMIDNPPNPHDKKLKDRLIDVSSPTAEEVHNDINNYLKNYDEIMEFYLNFRLNKEYIQSNQTKVEINEILTGIMTEMVDKFEFDILPLPEEPKEIIQEEQNEVTVNPSLVNNNGNIPQVKSSKKKISIKIDSPTNSSIPNIISPQNILSVKNKTNDLSKLKLPSSLSDTIYHNWSNFIDNYTYFYKEIFNNFKYSSNTLSSQLMIYQENFIQFISNQSTKKEIIKAFMHKYKSFLEQYNSIKLHELVIEDFNRDLSEMTDHIWALINEKKDAAIKELKRITSSDFVKSEMKKFHFNIEKMFILEANRLIMTINNLLYYLSNFNDMDSQLFELPKGTTYEILKNSDVLNYIKEDFFTKQITYPKLERIYKNCFIILFKLMVYLKQYNKSQYPTKGSNEGTPSPKRKRINIKSPEKSEISNVGYESDEMVKNSIKSEIMKFKFRISMLCSYGIFNLKRIFSVSKKVFDTMDEWIIDSVKYQNDAMNEIIEHLRSVISKAKVHEISKTVEMDDFHSKYQIINVNELLLNEANIITRKNSDVTDNSFSANYFGFLVQAIKDLEIQHNIISKSSFIEIFFIKNLLSKEKKVFFSEKFKKLNFHHFSSFLEYFVFLSSDICLKEKEHNDKEQPQELILTNAIMSVLLLSFIKIPSEDQAKLIKKDNIEKIYRNCLLKKEDFMNYSLWFENEKEYQEEMEILIEDEKQLRHYSKKSKVKEILFDLNKINDDEINIDIFIDTITLKLISKSNNKKELPNTLIKYYDLFTLSN